MSSASPIRKVIRDKLNEKRKILSRQNSSAIYSPSDENSFPPGAELCTKCNTKSSVMLDGCMTCLNCGYSKCG